MSKIINKKSFFQFSFIFLAFVPICIYYKIEKDKIEKNGIFILGKLSNVEIGGEQGVVYNFNYHYNYREYRTSFNGAILKSIIEDSILFLKILPNEPNISRSIINVEVPDSIKRQINSNWSRPVKLGLFFP